MDQNIIKVIALDMDNCILLNPATGTGSEELKAETWKTILPALFPKYTWNFLEQLLNDALKNKKVKNIYRDNIAEFIIEKLGEEGIEIGKEKIISKFNETLSEKILQLSIPKSIFETIEKIATKYPIYINTATEPDYGKEILHKLKISQYFKEILGLPYSKKENLEKICTKENVKSNEILFVDDSPKNAELAKKFNYQFIGVKTKKYSDWDYTKYKLISSLDDLVTILNL